MNGHYFVDIKLSEHIKACDKSQLELPQNSPSSALALKGYIGEQLSSLKSELRGELSGMLRMFLLRFGFILCVLVSATQARISRRFLDVLLAV